MKYLLIVACCFCFFVGRTQTIQYSEPDRKDSRSLDFEIIGKLNDHYLIYKNNRGDYSVSVYDEEMNQVASEPLDFLPNRLLSTDILTYRNFFYLFFQYQKRGAIHLMAAKLDGNAKLVGDVRELDTTNVGSFLNTKVYSLLYSENKQRISFVKINTRNPDYSQVTNVLFDADLIFEAKYVMNVKTPERNNFLTEFNLDDDGELSFIRAVGNSKKDNITELTLVTKTPDTTKAHSHPIVTENIYLDDIRLKVDNVNKNYLLISFYSKSKRGNVDGLYASLFNKNVDSVTSTTYTTFNEDLRNEAKSQGNAKYAFNDFFLQNVVMRNDGGYVVAAESAYSSSRGNQYNRWDYYNNYGFGMFNSPLYYNPFNSFGYGYGYYPWYRSGFGYQNTRYFADNIAILSFDSTAKLDWTDVIHKSQYDDNTDNFIGYTTMNTGNEVHFLYNETERKNILLSDQKLTAGGKVERTPTLKNLDRGYEFMPRLGKQVAAKQMIIPCTYRNYICFAKVDFQ